jgi:hypothetical protein
VHRDSVIFPYPIYSNHESEFLNCLLRLCIPMYEKSSREYDGMPTVDMKRIEKTSVVLSTLYKLTFTAFLKEHRFLHENGLIQEAVYTDGTRVVINLSQEYYSKRKLILPPLGFLVKHSQLTAHDALRVGDEEFATRAWRVRREGETDWTEL